MVAFDEGLTLADRFRTHAGDRDHLYGHAIRAMADDWEAGGPVRAVLRGHEDAPVGSLLQLRLLAGVFRLVLTGRAPQLVRFYPCLGGDDPPAQAWPVLRDVIAEHVDELRAALDVAPQTNEVGRSAALLVGLADVVRASGASRVRLLEPGASAGLNLLVDHFWFTAADGRWSWGDPRSPVRLEAAVQGDLGAAGAGPPPFAVVERRGCDLHPVDAGSAAGRLLLTSFVWPFQVERHRRLAAALRVAAEHPVRVETAGAGDWLTGCLAGDGDGDGDGDGEGDGYPGTLTVVWNSITTLYWPPDEVARVQTLLAAAGERRPLAHLRMEYPAGGTVGAGPEVRSTLWAGTGAAPRHRLLGTADDHGVPVRLLADPG